MTILREPVRWSRERTRRRTAHASCLTEEEQRNVREALRALARVRGCRMVVHLAPALGVSASTLNHPRRRVTCELAVRTARLAGVSVDDVLAGRWPKRGTCPLCGRSDP